MPRPPALLIALGLLATAQPSPAETGDRDPSFARGEAIYQRYCSRCHGVKADGEGRMVKRLYRRLGTQLPSNFTLGMYLDRPEAYLRRIILEGGESNDMSKYMPPFKDELSERDVDDLVHLIRQAPKRYARTAHGGRTLPGDR